MECCEFPVAIRADSEASARCFATIEVRFDCEKTSVTTETVATPRVGMLATLRNRRGLIASVEPFDAESEGRLHLVRVEYTDSDGVSEDTVIWEREEGKKLLEPHALPRVSETPPMLPSDFDALVRAARWSALTPFLAPDGSGAPTRQSVAAPGFGAVQVDDFQLVPLLKALQMPRVSLLLADDVGLGKTIEAGLILTELLLRRRVRRVLVICPASLRDQWHQEMLEKFALTFDMVDRFETHALQKRLGLDVNPWRTYPRIITSYHYLRQPDVLEQLMTTCRRGHEGAAHPAQLPWDLLIVDEAHNLMPSAFGEDSELAKMLRYLSPYFEHKLFLTATPHNGHTRCFSGLLELLDPVRFKQTGQFTPEEKQRIEEIVVRRLKREINELDDEAKRPRRFAERFLEPEPLFFRPEEKALASAFGRFRAAVKARIVASRRSEQLAGAFAIEVLNKRLLSSSTTFADSWFRMKRGLLEEEEPANAAEVAAARRASEEEIDDDREREGRAQHAARTVGSWLQPLLDTLMEEVAEIDAGLKNLGIREDGDTVTEPIFDTRFERLLDVIGRRVRAGKNWHDSERMIVFTEYKTTLDYLDRRLRETFGDSGSAIRVLYGSGGMDRGERDRIKAAFNDPNDPVRVLIATDAASEGLNLHETARHVLHYEIPWNPSRLEQRNGRLDRHGQARDVYVHHFTSEDDADLKFVAHVVGKVHEIREDLGSMGDVFDAAFQRRFYDQEDIGLVINSLDQNVKRYRGRASVPVRRLTTTGAEHLEALRSLWSEVDLSPNTLRETLEAALGLDVGHPRLEGPDSEGRMKLVTPLPPRWEPLIDDTLRLGEGIRGPLPALIFDPKLFVRDLGGRPVFRPAKDTVLLHLGHPLFRQALASFTTARFQAGRDLGATRWTLRLGGVPSGADCLILLTLEELAVNELREPFHHWVRTLRFPVRDGELSDALRHVPAADLVGSPIPSRDHDAASRRAADLWDEVGVDVQALVKRRAVELSEALASRLDQLRGSALETEKRRFADRLAEVRAAMNKASIQRLEKERDEQLVQMQQMVISEEMQRQRERDLRDLEAELERRRSHYADLLRQLGTDQKRVLEYTLPRRYRLAGAARVYPVAVEIWLPGGVA